MELYTDGDLLIIANDGDDCKKIYDTCGYATIEFDAGIWARVPGNKHATVIFDPGVYFEVKDEGKMPDLALTVFFPQKREMHVTASVDSWIKFHGRGLLSVKSENKNE